MGNFIKFAIVIIFSSMSGTNSSFSQSSTQRFLTPSEKSILKQSTFLSSKCTGSTLASCRGRDTIDFGLDCGFVSKPNGDDDDSSRRLVTDLDNLRTRLNEYPSIAKALNGYNDRFSSGISELKSIYNGVKNIVDGPGSRDRKARLAAPLFDKADKISKRLADIINVDYEGGCGADDDDSQEFSFVVSPKPKSAFYILVSDLNACKRNVNDPYDPNTCGLWSSMQPSGNMLSGNYVYKVVWDSGKTKSGTIRARGTQRATLEINE